MGHGATDCRVEVDQLQYRDGITGEMKRKLMLIPQAFLISMSIIIPAVMSAVRWVDI